MHGARLAGLVRATAVRNRKAGNARYKLRQQHKEFRRGLVLVVCRIYAQAPCVHALVP